MSKKLNKKKLFKRFRKEHGKGDKKPLLERMKNYWNPKRVVLVAGISLVVGGGVYFTASHFMEPATLTSAQQASLIKTEVKAVDSGQKPDDVIGGIEPRINKLQGNYQKQGAELAYTSVQRASLYYNNAAYMMTGETTYSRTNNDALSGTKQNQWLAGFVDEVKNQHMVPYTLNKDDILVLPNFDYLSKTYGQYATPDLKILLQTGKDAQDSDAFGKTSINSYKAAEAYNDIIKGYAKMDASTPNTKYDQDMNSLARIYHDVALGYVQTNDITKSSDGQYYTYSQSSYDQIKQIAGSKLFLAKDAKALVKKMNNKRQVPASFINDQSQKSVKTYGTSLYWQSGNDITALANQAGKTNSPDDSSNSNKNTTKKDGE